MKKERKYKIGQAVEVLAEAVFTEDEKDNRVVRRKIHSKPRYGQVTGAGFRFTGRVKHSEGYDQGYLIIDKKHIVWKVRYGVTNKEVDVFEEDMNLAFARAGEVIPWRWTNPFPWSSKARQDLSRWSRDFPRDKRGRWIK